MPYTNAQATPRSDIYALVMQANADFNKMFIGDQVLPVKGEDVKRGIYMKAKLANGELMNGDAKPRAAGAAYDRINRVYDVDQYDTENLILHECRTLNAVEHVSRHDDSVWNDAFFEQAQLSGGNISGEVDRSKVGFGIGNGSSGCVERASVHHSSGNTNFVADAQRTL